MRPLAVSLLVLSAALTHAQSALQASYFALSGPGSGIATHPDTGNGIDFAAVTGLVQNSLGPTGLPVVSPYGRTYSGPSGPISDFSTTTGEILWWTPHSPTGGGQVSADGGGTVSLPLDSSEYAFGASDNKSWYRTARLQATFQALAGGTATFTLGSDDDAWIFLNGALVVDNGGVHPMTPAPTTLTNLLTGTNRIDVFFADRHIVDSHLILNADVVLTPLPTPEPSGWAALAVGGLALVRRRRPR